MGRRPRNAASEGRAPASGAGRRFGRREHVRSEEGADGVESFETLHAEVVLLREENAALKAAQHQPPSIGRALRHVRSLPAAPVDGAELADDAAQMLVDGLVLRESLLEVCEELEQAMGRVRARLDALGATPGPDELEAAAHAGYNGAGAMEAGLNGHGAGHG